jgi:hypothetical protein
MTEMTDTEQPSSRRTDAEAPPRDKFPAAEFGLGTRTQGRPRMSMADVLYAVLTDWKKFVGFVVLWFLLICTAGISVWLLLRIWQSSGLRATSVEISSSPRIVLEQVSDEGREYLLMVQPQGWINSGIPIRPGDEVEFHAQGMVNITSATLNDHISLRRRIERRLSDERAAGAFGPIPDSAWLPERYFTDVDRDSLEHSLPRSWLTPDGDTGPNGLIDSRYQARAKNKILPKEPYGVLVAAIHGSDTPPARYNGFSSAFAVGSSDTVSWSGARGTLWFTVNDVLDDQDDHLPLKFFIDNIGFFMVRVTIRHD